MHRPFAATPAAIALAAAVALAACSAPGAAPGSASPPSTAPGASSTPGADPSGGRPSVPHVDLPSTAPSLDPSGLPVVILEAALDAVAEEAGIDPSQVQVVEATPTTWPNGALGCPKPGEVYTQALVPGWKIVVEVGGEQVEIHASNDGAARICTRPGAG